MMSSDVFFNGNVIFTTVLNRYFNCLPDGQKIFNLHKKFSEKPNWLLENKENFNFERQQMFKMLSLNILTIS
jgi:hypothetical protein